MQDIDALLLQIYRGSREVPWRHFQNWALDLLREHLHFDSAWWGKGSYQPGYVHHLHTYRCRPNIIEDYRRWIDDDFVREAVMARVGQTVSLGDIVKREDFVRMPVYQGFCKPHGIEWSMATVWMTDEAVRLIQWISLRRSDPQRPFNENERRFKQRLMPHLIEAERNCWHYYLRESGARLQNEAWALCDALGMVHEISPRFADIVRLEWPSWVGAMLPPELVTEVMRRGAFSGQRIVVSDETVNDMHCLFARRRNALDSLSERERQIARRYSAGEGHAGIAQALQLSPATVRNHLQSIYRKLGVNNKAELARLLPD